MTQHVAPTDARPPVAPAKKFPVSVYLHYPKGTGLCRGAVALRNGPKITTDTYTIRKGKGGEDPGPVLMEAINALLRTAPNKPVRYVISTEDRSEYRAVRESIDSMIKRAGLTDIQYGSSFMETDILRFAAEHALAHPNWKDMHSGVHSYVTTVGSGAHCYTSIITSSPRHLRWAESTSQVFDPVVANLTAIRDSLVGVADRSNAGVWSSCEAVNAIIRGERVSFTAEAGTSARELNAYRKNKNLGLVFNQEASWPLMQLGLYLAHRQQRRHLEELYQKGRPS